MNEINCTKIVDWITTTGISRSGSQISPVYCGHILPCPKHGDECSNLQIAFLENELAKAKKQIDELQNNLAAPIYCKYCDQCQNCGGFGQTESEITCSCKASSEEIEEHFIHKPSTQKIFSGVVPKSLPKSEEPRFSLLEIE